MSISLYFMYNSPVQTVGALHKMGPSTLTPQQNLFIWLCPPPPIPQYESSEGYSIYLPPTYPRITVSHVRVNLKVFIPSRNEGDVGCISAIWHTFWVVFLLVPEVPSYGAVRMQVTLRIARVEVSTSLIFFFFFFNLL